MATKHLKNLVINRVPLTRRPDRPRKGFKSYYGGGPVHLTLADGCLFRQDTNIRQGRAAPNATLTFVALAIRQLGHIAESMLKREL